MQNELTKRNLLLVLEEGKLIFDYQPPCTDS